MLYHHRVQTGSGAHRASYPVGTRGFFSGGKATGAWRYHSHLMPRPKNAWSCNSTPQFIIMAWSLVKHKDFTFLPLILTWSGFFICMLTIHEGVSKSFRTESITKYTLTTINTRWEPTQRVMAAKLTSLTHEIGIQRHLVAESCPICSSRSRRPVRKLLDTPS
jgi:hypothetical protein